MRMQLNLVSFEQATALKNLGFPALSADWSYRNDGELYNFVDDDGYVTAAPTLELAAKWLREEKQIMIDTIYEYRSPQSWSANVTSRKHMKTVPVAGIRGELWGRTYEEILSQAINVALTVFLEQEL